MILETKDARGASAKEDATAMLAIVQTARRIRIDEWPALEQKLLEIHNIVGPCDCVVMSSEAPSPGDYARLQDILGKLQSLLESPEYGLHTWYEAVAAMGRHAASFLTIEYPRRRPSPHR